MIFLEMQTATEQHFKEKYNTILGHLAVPGKQVTDDDVRSLMFGDYMGNDGTRTYNEIRDQDELQKVAYLLLALSFILFSLLQITSQKLKSSCFEQSSAEDHKCLMNLKVDFRLVFSCIFFSSVRDSCSCMEVKINQLEEDVK